MHKVLVTGGAGFLGSNLVRKLIGSYEVSIVEKPGVDLWRLDGIKDKVDVWYRYNYQDVTPDVVFHLASYGVYGEKDEKEMQRVNVKGTMNLAFAIQSSPCFVYAGSSFEYKPKGALKETDTIEPWNFYAKTKHEAWRWIENIAMSVRLFTPYGYYEDERRIVPTIILKGLKDERIELSSPDSVRDFIFIDDVTDLFLKIAKSNQKHEGEVFNVGVGKQHSVREVVEVVEKVMNKKLDVHYGKESIYKEPKEFYADITKVKKTFDWEPKHSLEEGIAKIIKWYENN